MFHMYRFIYVRFYSAVCKKNKFSVDRTHFCVLGQILNDILYTATIQAEEQM